MCGLLDKLLNVLLRIWQIHGTICDLVRRGQYNDKELRNGACKLLADGSYFVILLSMCNHFIFCHFLVSYIKHISYITQCRLPFQLHMHNKRICVYKIILYVYLQFILYKYTYQNTFDWLYDFFVRIDWNLVYKVHFIPLPGLQRNTFWSAGSRSVQGRYKYNRELEMWTKGGMRIIRPYYHLWSACSPWSHERVPAVSTPFSFVRSLWRQSPNEWAPDSFIKISKEQVNEGG